MFVDLYAVIANCRAYLVPYARQVGELSAEAETHYSDLAGASLVSCERGDSVSQIGGKLICVHLPAQRLRLRAAFVGIGKVVAGFFPPIDVWRYDDEPVLGVTVDDSPDMVVCVEDLPERISISW